MIISRSPLRITLGGGGTDLKSYYEENEGYLISAAIDKYVYVSVMRPFSAGIFLKYSKLEHVKKIADLQHPIIKEALQMLENDPPQIEITTLADIPSGTGLGSSGSFTTALLKALYAFKKQHLNQNDLAKLACEIEIDRLGEPIGKQDQYIAAYGGLTCFTFHRNDDVTAAPLEINEEVLTELEDNLLLFFTGFSRSASEILEDQKVKSQKKDGDMLNNLHYVKQLGIASRDALISNDMRLFGELMHEHWEHKKSRSGGMSNPKIDEWYRLAKAHGAIGGKLVGAGGGGFLMFMAHDRNKLRASMKTVGLQEVRFKFDFQGTKILTSD